MNMMSLQETFKSAIDNNSEYVAVKVSMQGFKGCEIIINPKENFKEKLVYYTNAYNDNLTLKTFNGIKIVDATHGSMIDIDKHFKER